MAKVKEGMHDSGGVKDGRAIGKDEHVRDFESSPRAVLGE